MKRNLSIGTKVEPQLAADFAALAAAQMITQSELLRRLIADFCAPMPPSKEAAIVEAIGRLESRIAVTGGESGIGNDPVFRDLVDLFTGQAAAFDALMEKHDAAIEQSKTDARATARKAAADAQRLADQNAALIAQNQEMSAEMAKLKQNLNQVLLHTVGPIDDGRMARGWESLKTGTPDPESLTAKMDGIATQLSAVMDFLDAMQSAGAAN